MIDMLKTCPTKKTKLNFGTGRLSSAAFANHPTLSSFEHRDLYNGLAMVLNTAQLSFQFRVPFTPLRCVPSAAHQSFGG